MALEMGPSHPKLRRWAIINYGSRAFFDRKNHVALEVDLRKFIIQFGITIKEEPDPKNLDVSTERLEELT